MLKNTFFQMIKMLTKKKTARSPKILKNPLESCLVHFTMKIPVHLLMKLDIDTD